MKLATSFSYFKGKNNSGDSFCICSIDCENLIEDRHPNEDPEDHRTWKTYDYNDSVQLPVDVAEKTEHPSYWQDKTTDKEWAEKQGFDLAAFPNFDRDGCVFECSNEKGETVTTQDSYESCAMSCNGKPFAAFREAAKQCYCLEECNLMAICPSGGWRLFHMLVDVAAALDPNQKSIFLHRSY